jgi:DNA repair photolyase
MSDFIYHLHAVNIWSINPYRGCAHRCLYCIADSQGESIPWHNRETIIPALREGLATVPPDEELFVGSLTDAYPPVEQEFRLTRLVVEELIAQRHPFCLCTKSDIVCREIDLLQGYAGHCDVSLSLCSLDDAVLTTLEPGAPSATTRMRALHLLCEAGIEVIIDAAPWIPGISDTAALIARRPSGIPIQFAPLHISHPSGAITLLGRQYTLQEINSSYQRERERFANIPGVIWKEPL